MGDWRGCGDLAEWLRVRASGSQVSYRLKQLQEEIKLPIAEVPSLDYAIGNAENVMKLAHKLCDNK